jgi:hypothetical protein
MAIANKSENKVRVTKLFGKSAPMGVIDPKVNMRTDMGPILALDSGNYTVVVGRGSGSFQQRFYPHQLLISEAEATGVWSWPTGDGSVKFGHSAGINANGPPVAVGSGTSVLSADSTVHTFGR